MGYREKEGNGKRIMEPTETLRLRAPSKHNVMSVRTLGHKASSVMYQHCPENQSCSLFSTFLGGRGGRGQPVPGPAHSCSSCCAGGSSLSSQSLHSSEGSPQEGQAGFWSTAGLQETVPLHRPRGMPTGQTLSAIFPPCHQYQGLSSHGRTV